MTRYGADQCPYCYPGTEVLKNKFNIRNEKKLSDLEKMSTLIRDAELVETPIKGLFDLNHLQKIHRYLFRDIYDFAGKTRTIILFVRETGERNVCFYPLCSSKCRI
ncbi:toxin-antitoxin system, toxin component, Fic domain protein [Aneurinibacillus aneurinilyticus ATCC 12856]|uniref:protein adenylyltransferase n=1 Tax=Aneurinibacillus aneurinilyticus ATCC 12856 TaxID=649747 RepID=U1X8T0_ANEAE|nr:toxin-antitoxin system, toxin component, Fic domain protein [Aneurinibacillus aneurinilyticus ATCC 12856]